MQKYQDFVLDSKGRAVRGATVTVTTSAGATATIYSDNGSTTQANPMTTGTDGGFAFYAADGRYNLSISGTGFTSKTVTDILLEDPVDSGFVIVEPTAPTTPNAWWWDFTNADGAGQQQLTIDVPATVEMTGGGAVQGCGLIFTGETSADTPNAGLAEQNMIRMNFTVKDDAGSKVQVHLINGTLTLANDEDGTGNEGAILIGTTRATGPISGSAVGLWGGDLHVEKTAGVASGKMVGLEVGVHSAVSQATGDTATRMNGIEVWSGDRSGIEAVAAHNAIDIFGDAGWTNFIRARHTDNSTDLFKVTADGDMTLRAPSGDQAVTFTTNGASTTSAFVVSGQTGAGAAVNALLQCEAGGQITFGAATNHHLVVIQNGSEVVRFINGFLWSSPAGVESTGAGSAALGANCPATTTSAPFTWLKVRTSDGSTAYVPAWK